MPRLTFVTTIQRVTSLYRSSDRVRARVLANLLQRQYRRRKPPEVRVLARELNEDTWSVDREEVR
jgi:hypothetical protein